VLEALKKSNQGVNFTVKYEAHFVNLGGRFDFGRAPNVQWGQVHGLLPGLESGAHQD